MGTLIPGAVLIYERANGVVYARYRDPPHNTIPRWVIGGDPVAVSVEQGDIVSYDEWRQLCVLAEEHPTLKKLLDQLVVTYYMIKESR